MMSTVVAFGGSGAAAGASAPRKLSPENLALLHQSLIAALAELSHTGGLKPLNTGRNRSSAVEPTSAIARSRSFTPGIWTRMFDPCRVISGSATPSESMRFRMIEIARILRETPLGLRLRAARENEVAAAASGAQTASLCPSITKYEYVDGQGDTQKAIADIQGLETRDLEGSFRTAPLKDDEGPRHQPVTRRQTGQGRFPQTLAIGRIEEHQTKAVALVRAHLRRIAPPDIGHAHGAGQFDVAAKQGAGGCAVIDECRLRRTARQRLQPQCAGAREQVEYTRPRDRVAVAAVDQQVEDRLAHAVRGGAQMRLRVALAHGGKMQAAKLAPDDPHLT